MEQRYDPLIRPGCSRLLFVLLLALLGACTTLPPNKDLEPTFAIRDTAQTALGRAIKSDVDAHPGESGFHLLPSGLDAFAARALLAYRAEKTIDAKYYLMHNDLTGKLFLDMLLQQAKLGVRVRLLVDDMALDDSKDISVAALHAHPNIEIRVFNPFGRDIARWVQYVSRLGEVTRRMHGKSFTIDNQVTIIGGRNIGNEYFEVDENLVFGDLDVIAVGPVVDTVSTMFDEYWNNAMSFPVTKLVKGRSTPADLAAVENYLTEFARQQQDSPYLNALRESPIVERLRDWTLDFEWGEGELLYDHPDKITAARDRKELMLSAQLDPYLDSVESELLIFSAYFVPGKDGVEQLRRMRERGVRVRVITNSLASTDVAIVHAGYARYRWELLNAGVELYEVDRTLSRLERRERRGPTGSSKASLHAKSFVIDGERAFIGSLNFDPRSVIENTEIGLMIESPRLAKEMIGWFDEIAEKASFRVGIGRDHNGDKRLRWYRQRDGREDVYITEPNTSFWRRLGVHFMRLLPVEPLL